MKNARRNIALAAVAAASLALAPSALADVRIHVSLPLPPSPHQVLKHLPVPPLPPPPVVGFGHSRHDGGHYDGRWNCDNRWRDDRYAGYHHNGYDSDRYVWIGGRWVLRPYPGAVWVNGYYDRWGHWVAGYWTRTYCR